MIKNWQRICFFALKLTLFAGINLSHKKHISASGYHLTIEVKTWLTWYVPAPCVEDSGWESDVRNGHCDKLQVILRDKHSEEYGTMCQHT